MAKKYEDFDEEVQGGVFEQVLIMISIRQREFAIVSVLAAVVVLGLIVWDGNSGGADGPAESVPIVRADANDYKAAPDNPGGMEIPYRDSTVFASGNADGGTENILADAAPEDAPLPKEELFAGLNTQEQVPPVAVTETPAPVIADGNKVEPVLPPANDTLVSEAIGLPPLPGAADAAEDAPIAFEPAPVAKVEEKKVEPKVAEKVAKTEPAAGAASAAKAVTPGGSYVQLASVKNVGGAASEYKKMQVKYPSLSGVSFRTQEANLGAKGTFHRIQAGPMSKDSAASVCNAIKAKGGSCLVVTK